MVNIWRYRHCYCWWLETKSNGLTMTSALFQLLVSMSGVVSSFELPRYPPVADTTITHSVMLALRDNKISSDNKAQISSDNQRSRGQFLQKTSRLFISMFLCLSVWWGSQPAIILKPRLKLFLELGDLFNFGVWSSWKWLLKLSD